MAVKRLFTELMVNKDKMVYVVEGDTYEVREELKKRGFEWNPMNSQWEMALTGTKKEIVAQAKQLNEELKELNLPVDFSAKRSNIALRNYAE